MGRGPCSTTTRDIPDVSDPGWVSRYPARPGNVLASSDAWDWVEEIALREEWSVVSI